MDSIHAQLQIRQNALEAQEYAQDLMAWQRDMQAKGSSTKQQHAARQHHPQLPVRGRASGAVAAVEAAAKQSADPQPGKEAHPAAHTYKNYSKWDKFDVDAALEATEAASSSSSSKAARPRAVPAPSSVRDQQQQQPPMMEPVVPNAPTQTPASKAAALKDQGNTLFQARYYEDAISCYSQSIDAHPTAVAYANRAMALLKLDKHCEAEADCTAALQLDPCYVKAWHRRATARKQLGQLLQAASDYEEALRLEPSNGPLQADRDQALDQALKQQQLQRNSSSSTWHSIPVKLQPGTPPQRQQQQQAPSAPAAAGSPKQDDEQLPGKPSPQQQQPPQDATSTAAAGNGAVRPVTPTGTSSSRGSSAQASPQQRQAVAAAAQAAAEQLAARLASSLKAPKTGHEFESAWRSLKGDVQLQGKYLRLLTPQQLPTLFKSSLTAQLVSSLLTAALTAIAQQPPPQAAPPASDDAGEAQQQQQQQQLSPGHAVGLVEGLAAVPRFSMMAMSLGSRDKAALRQLWDAAAAVLAGDGDLQRRLAAVRPQYRL